MAHSGAKLRAWLVAWVALLLPAGARAGVAIPIPPGWVEARAPEEAFERAEAWAEGGSRVERVLTPAEDDDFAETLAILAIPRPLDARALSDPEQAMVALAEAGRDLLDAEDGPAEMQLVAVAGDTTALTGRWEDDAMVVRVALVPTGATHAAIVLAVRPRADVLYSGVFESSLAAVEGGIAPAQTFARGKWLKWSWMFWLLAGVVGAVFVVRARDGGTGPVPVARRVAAVLVGAVVVVAVIAAIATSSLDAELARSGVSAPWMVVQIGIGGLVVAGSLVAGATLWERRSGPIASAPTGATFSPWAQSPTGPLTIPGAAAPPAPAGPPHAPERAPERDDASAFPSPGRPSALAELALDDEPSARLEIVGVPEAESLDEPASLATAQITLDHGRRPLGGRFR